MYIFSFITLLYIFYYIYKYITNNKIVLYRFIKHKMKQELLLDSDSDSENFDEQFEKLEYNKN